MMRPALVCGSLLLLVAVFAIFPLIALDLPTDLAIGRATVEEGAIPTTNVTLHPQIDYPVAAGPWLHRVIVHLADRTAGSAGLLLLRLLLALAIAFSAYRLARRFAAPHAAAFAVLLSVPFLVHRMGLRPELWTYLFAALFLTVLLGRPARRGGWSFVLILLQVAWANLDAGFVLGPGLVLLAGLGDLVRGRWRPLGLIALLGIASLLHPDGAGVYTNLGLPAGPHTFWSAEVPWCFTTVGALVAAAIALLGALRADRPRENSVGVAPAGLLAVGILAPQYLPLAGLGVVALAAAAPPLSERRAGILVPTLSALTILLIVIGPLADPAADGRNFGAGWSRRTFPVNATAELVQDRPAGEAFTDIACGGYYAYRAHPYKRAFIDADASGYPAVFLDHYRKILDLEVPHRSTKKLGVSHFFLRHDAASTRTLMPALFQDEGLIVFTFDEVATVFMAREETGARDQRGKWLADVLPRVRDTLFPRRRQAEALLRQAAKLADSNPDTALDLIRQAVGLDPWNSRAFRLAARAYRKKGDTEREVLAWRRGALLEGTRLRVPK